MSDSSPRAEGDDGARTVCFRKVDPNYANNIADHAVDFAARWVYEGSVGQYNGVEGDSPFAAMLGVGIYTAGADPSVTLDEPDRVQLVATAALYITKEPAVAHRTRAVLAARLRVLAQNIEAIELPGPDGVVA